MGSLSGKLEKVSSYSGGFEKRRLPSVGVTYKYVELRKDSTKVSTLISGGIKLCLD